MSQLDYAKVEHGIASINQALADSDMPNVETHLLSLQQMLQGTPHLVDMLLPSDLGTLVNAERARMRDDILAQSMPKKRVSKPRQKMLKISDIDDNDLGDF